MKKLFIYLSFVLLIIATSCRGYYQEYSIQYERIVPDSSIEAYQHCMIELIAASNATHSAGKSKNKGHIINEAKWIALRLYAVDVPVLYISNYYNSSPKGYVKIRYDELDDAHRKIFDNILEDLENGPRQ